MIKLAFKSRVVDGVIEEVLDLVQRNVNKRIFYFHGWEGYGATALLSYMARVLPSMKDSSPGLRFGRIIYLDCSIWTSKRALQRKIAEELKLDHKTMAMFQEQDQEDDFNGVDHASRDVIWDVAAVIDQTLRETRFMLFFINGSDDEIILSLFGIPEYHDCVIIWTFRRSSVLDMHEGSVIFETKIRHTSVILCSLWRLNHLTSPQLSALLREEAATLAGLPDINLTMAIDCFFYRSFLEHGLGTIAYRTNFREHDPSSFWLCDGVIQGDRAKEISNALHPKIGVRAGDDIIFSYLSRKTETPYLIIRDDDFLDAYRNRQYRWIAIEWRNNFTSMTKKVQEDLQTTLARASSTILEFALLPNDFFKQCNSLCVLILSCCSFSFVSPPFLHCHTLRLLDLNHCTDDHTTQPEGEDDTTKPKWACLHSLQVLHLHYTEWCEILSEENMDFMANLTELNIEGVWCWQWISGQLEKRLPYLQRLQIIKPARQMETSTDTSNSFTDKTKLQILDLSGNGHMKKLPTSLSKASRLHELILDGCVGLENVELANPSVKSFSFDGSNHVDDDQVMSSHSDKQNVKISKISLEGCTQLKKLILCGLPNLVELDLSGCAIKILDFGTMVKDVPRLKRLFLLGCEHLHAIKFESTPGLRYRFQFQGLLLCIDTRPARMLGCTRPSIAKHEGFELQVHATIVDARLARSLCSEFYHVNNVYFNINITSSTACSGAVQPEATNKGLIVESSNQQHHAVSGLYGDVFSKVGDDPIPMQAFPQPPVLQSDRHIEIGDGSRNVQSELEVYSGISLCGVLALYTISLHVHDAFARIVMPARRFYSLRWCRVERCPNIDAIFPSGALERGNALETIWISDLLKARCIWSKGHDTHWGVPSYFQSLRHLHLCSCPCLQYALPVWVSSFPSLETLHIIHCGSLRHVFDQDQKHQRSVQFPKLTTIHLHDLPALQQICEDAETLAPALETIKIRGCWSLRRLPALKGREVDMKKPSVEIEKDVWDALEWDGVDASHHPYLYEAPVHSRYYKRRLLRRTVLR